jgi:hypothetical protein
MFNSPVTIPVLTVILKLVLISHVNYKKEELAQNQNWKKTMLNQNILLTLKEKTKQKVWGGLMPVLWTAYCSQ